MVIRCDKFKNDTFGLKLDKYLDTYFVTLIEYRDAGNVILDRKSTTSNLFEALVTYQCWFEKLSKVDHFN